MFLRLPHDFPVMDAQRLHLPTWFVLHFWLLICCVSIAVVHENLQEMTDHTLFEALMAENR